jgi:quinol monooxygenase YgiN
MVHCVYRWTVDRSRLAEHTEALTALGAHIRDEHPLIKEVRCWTVLWGAEAARPGRVWVETFESMTAYEKHEAEEYTAACDEAWKPVFATMVPGTMTSAVWTDAVPEAWVVR